MISSCPVNVVHPCIMTARLYPAPTTPHNRGTSQSKPIPQLHHASHRRRPAPATARALLSGAKGAIIAGPECCPPAYAAWLRLPPPQRSLRPRSPPPPGAEAPPGSSSRPDPLSEAKEAALAGSSMSRTDELPLLQAPAAGGSPLEPTRAYATPATANAKTTSPSRRRRRTSQ